MRRILEKQLNKYRPGWRERANRRKSFWHLPKVILSFVLLGVVWYLLFKVMWEMHVYAYPEHQGHLDMFWKEGLSLEAFVSSFLLLIPLFLPAMGVAFVVTNGLFWLIPPARKVFEKEADGDSEMTFIGATSGLAAILLKYLLPIGLGLSMLGALTLSSMK